MKKLAFLLLPLSVLLFASCSNDDDTGENSTTQINFSLTHNWDAENISEHDFGEIQFTNSFGNELSITLLRYLISDIKLHHANGETFEIKDYHLANLEEQTTLSFVSETDIPVGEYTKISFTFGMDEEANSGNYPDLNAASWNWPEMLGGGYHFMQLEGQFNSSEGVAPYAYHHGTARESEGVFEANHFSVQLETDMDISEDTTIELQMNLAEWFKNPNTWNLEEFSTDLMMNYEAQKMMQENGATVFTFGSITP